MKRIFLSLLLTLGLASMATAQSFQLQSRVSHTPVVVGPSGYLAARNTGAAPLVFEIVDLGQGHVGLRDVASGQFVSSGNTQYDYLGFSHSSDSAWARFERIDRGDATLFRSVNSGAYVGWNAGSGRLRAVHSADDPLALWLLVAHGTQAADHTYGITGLWQAQALRGENGAWLNVPHSELELLRLDIWPSRLNADFECVIHTLTYSRSGNRIRVMGRAERPQACNPWVQTATLLAQHRALWNAHEAHVDEVGQLVFTDVTGMALAVYGRIN